MDAANGGAGVSKREHAVEIRHAHLFCGIGGGARGFNRGAARHGNLVAKFRCIGGIDHAPGPLADFARLAQVQGALIDLFNEEQYRAFHGNAPPTGWCEAMPADVRTAFGGEHPHIVFLSAPCKGFSGLLPEQTSKTAKYQALNGLTSRGVWLTLEAFKDDPVELILFENVPRIQTRGRHLLDQIAALMRAYGYAWAETTHDCGEIGGLAQSRKRFLGIARHTKKVPAFVYEPPQRGLRGVGEVLSRLPMPDETTIGMHRMPALHWRTWVRLAFVEAGSDWRSLNKLEVENGVLRDFGIAPDANWHSDVFGVRNWEQPSGAITSRSGPTNGAFAVADPRVEDNTFGGLSLNRWNETAPTITTSQSPGASAQSVADPRIVDRTPFNHAFRIVDWRVPSPAISTAQVAVADPRYSWTGAHESKMRVQHFDEPSRTITSSDRVGSGALAVADPRHQMVRETRAAFDGGGHYGVVRWDETSGAISASAMHDNGRWSVADPRPTLSAASNEDVKSYELPKAGDRLVCLICALDGTWHRPITTLEMAALQSLFDPDDFREFELHGKSDSAWREGIGNAVPCDSATAIATVMGRTLLAVWSGQTFMLSSEPIWVKPLAIALSVDTSGAVA